MESIPQNLSHKTHLRHKAFLSGVFTYALQKSVIFGTNPMDACTAGGQTKGRKAHELTPRELKIRASQKHAYTLEEVATMLDKLPEPARTVCAVSALTGFTRSELKGLKWGDYEKGYIKIQRKIVGTEEGQPKTAAREEGVYLAPLLQKILAKYKQSFPPGPDGWMFRGEKLGRPLDLDNLSRRVIPQFINGAWFGWHAFRRGLGTRLNDIGVDDKNIQSILRHGQISTTQAFYILPNEERKVAGLKKFERTLREKYNIKA